MVYKGYRPDTVTLLSKTTCLGHSELPETRHLPFESGGDPHGTFVQMMLDSEVCEISERFVYACIYLHIVVFLRFGCFLDWFGSLFLKFGQHFL
jgi:hypothetical protein